MFDELYRLINEVFVEVKISTDGFKSERNWELVEDPSCEGGWTHKGNFITKDFNLDVPKEGTVMMKVKSLYLDKKDGMAKFRQWFDRDLESYKCRGNTTFYKLVLDEKLRWEKGKAC